MSLDITLRLHGETVFEYNITHNLNEMASAADLYYTLWYPSASSASGLIIPLAKGLQSLLDKPEYYKTFNPSNGWGSYEGLVKCVSEYLKAAVDYPEAEIFVDR